ncbi:MAG: hypothetical protein V1848_02520 [Candidatus Magasanikbacteria bacterium]
MALTQSAQKMIDHYKNLHIGNSILRTPYFINKGNKVRGGLRVAIGKGSPEDIEDEAKIISMKNKIDVNTLTQEQTLDFLIDQNLGIDCSGFVYHVLNEEMKEKKNTSLHTCLTYKTKNPLRKLLTKLRPAENTSVQVLADEKNTEEIQIKNVQPGDMIILMGTGEQHELNHILLVTDVEKENETIKTIHYTHSLKWKQDKKNQHGVRDGKIHITDINKPITEQQWNEQEKIGEENETLWRAKTAQKIKIGRIQI